MSTEQPIIVPPLVVTLLTTITRIVLVSSGVATTAKAADLAQQVVGVSLTLAAVAWSLYASWKKNHDATKMQALLPDEVAAKGTLLGQAKR